MYKRKNDTLEQWIGEDNKVESPENIFEARRKEKKL